MIKIGDYNILKVGRIVEFGAYLYPLDQIDSEHPEEVLLPKRYVENTELQQGDEIKVFVYTDSEDRPVATTEQPFAKVGEFAFLQTVQVNRVGAFMDWGLQKNLLVPFKEQKIKMFPGGIYLVYIYLDMNTRRVVASAKVEKFLDNVFPEYTAGDKVNALLIGRNEVGYQTIVNNLHRGLIYFNEVYRPLEIGQQYEAFVKNIRAEDGRIDLTLTQPGTLGRIEKVSKLIIETLTDGKTPVNDNFTPDEIKTIFHCSKKDFKKAVGYLYRNQKIVITNEGDLRLNRKGRSEM